MAAVVDHLEVVVVLLDYAARGQVTLEADHATSADSATEATHATSADTATTAQNLASDSTDWNKIADKTIAQSIAEVWTFAKGIISTLRSYFNGGIEVTGSHHRQRDGQRQRVG